MYTTSQVVERLKLQATNWSTAELLPIVNEVNNEMMRGDFEHSIVIDSTTGLPPALATTSGVYEYDAPDDCRKIADVLVEYDYNRGNFQPFDNYGNWTPSAWRGRRFYSVPGTSRRRTLTANATYTFRDNPATTTDMYLIKYWKEPTSITSVNTQIDVPPEFQLVFLDGCIFRTRALMYGKYDEWNAWLERMKMEFYGDMNNNPPMNKLTTLRPC